MIPYTPPQAITSLPIIDLSMLRSPRTEDRAAIAAQIRSACLNTGFFYVTHHGIPSDAFTRQYALSRTFFDLSLNEKLAIAQSKSFAKRGYEPQAAQVLDEGSPPDLKESFRFGRDPSEDNPYLNRRLPTYGPNQWPTHPEGLSQAMLPYHDAMESVGRQVLAGLALSLDLHPTYFESFYEHPMSTVRLLKYPPMPANAEDNQIGAGAHTDWGGITVLSQDGVGGLEVRNVDGVWIQAPPMQDALIVNIGELMSRWTNGRYRSTLHRVKNNALATDRYSIAFFFDPSYDALIDCIPSCIGPGEERQFAPCSAGEHIAYMHKLTSGTVVA